MTVIEKCNVKFTDVVSILSNESKTSDAFFTETHRITLCVIARITSILNSKRLLSISQIHIDAVTYIGPGELVQLNCKASVRTT